MAFDATTYALAKNYSNVVGSRITSTSYDYDTSQLTFDTIDGESWSLTVNNGMNSGYKNTLDNIKYDTTDEKLKINGAEVLTKSDEASGDINFDDFFD
jgi:hypothetical protein